MECGKRNAEVGMWNSEVEMREWECVNESAESRLRGNRAYGKAQREKGRESVCVRIMDQKLWSAGADFNLPSDLRLPSAVFCLQPKLNGMWL